MKSALNKVRKHFPQVIRIVEAKKPLLITVLKQDCRTGKKKSPMNCALARACVRDQHADGAMINIGTSYVIRGKTATRYITSQTVGREITSFDRHHDFASGRNYRLMAVPPSVRLGSHLVSKRKKPTGPKLSKSKKALVAKAISKRHYTTRVR